MSNFLSDVLILGEGGAGVQIVKEIIKNDKKGKYNCGLIVASDVERDKIRDIENELVGIVQLGVDGTGKNPELGYNACDEKSDEIDDLVSGYGIVFHILGFAGGTGVGSALYIGEKYPASEGVKYHYFVGAMPEFEEKADLLGNAMQAISILEKYGRIWAMDNRLGNNKITYKKINEKIAEEVLYVLNLPDYKTYSIRKDMDSNNVLDVLFPEGYRDQGIFTFKRIVLPDLTTNIPFEKLDEYDTSISLKLDYKYFGRAGYMIILNNANEMVDKAEEYIDKFKKWFVNKLPAADKIHDSIIIDLKPANEIVIFMSGPTLPENQLKDFLDEIERQESDELKAREKLFSKSFVYQKKDISSFKKKEKPNPFKTNQKSNPFSKKKDSGFLDLLGK